MDDTTKFENKDLGFCIEAKEHDGIPVFAANLVCSSLDIGNVTKALYGLDDDEKITLTNGDGNPRAGIPHQLNYVTEAGLYSLILRSRKPEAKAFKRWIIHEVLPAIRRHGGYLTPAKIEEALLNPDTIIRLATDLKAERAQRIALEAQSAADRPKVDFADAVSSSRTSILIGDLAKLLRQNGVEIGQNRLFHWLRENGYLMRHGERRNLPTQHAMDMDLFEVVERTIDNPDGSIRITRTTKITGKGQIYFVNKFRIRKSA